MFQESSCSHEYQKNCFIEYNKVAKEYDVERCHQGMQRDCDLPGDTVCTIEAEVGERRCGRYDTEEQKLTNFIQTRS